MSIGTPLSASATRVLLLGSGELGKEVAIALQQLGAEVIAADRYADAPAMQVAHRSHVIDMLDADALRELVAAERPDLVVPEIEAIATEVLVEVEQQGVMVVPTARATALTMNREGIRRLAAEELGLPTSSYRFVDTEAELARAVAEVGLPCVVKPVMSSSGKGQSVVRDLGEIAAAWRDGREAGRSTGTRLIVEGFVEFDEEITLLTVRHAGGTSLLDPIGHTQVDGDYRESWQPQPLSEVALKRAHHIARVVTDSLGGYGVFGVELFVRGDEVLFSEVSPRPHDTGLVTLASLRHSEFVLHARAILGLPVSIEPLAVPGSSAPGSSPAGSSPAGSYAAASCAVVAEGAGVPRFEGVAEALAVPGADLRLFGKPRVDGRRRVAVTVARAANVGAARAAAREAAAALTVHLE